MTLYDPPPKKTVPVALLGEDYPGLRIKPAVAQGDEVAVGQTLFFDANRSAIAFVSPIPGRVTELQYGPRRMLSAVTLDPAASGPVAPSDRLTDDSQLRAYLLARGAWPAFTARPFGAPPDPDAQPDAIVVSAVSSSLLGFSPHEILSAREAEFAHGLTALQKLTDGPVHLCVEHGTPQPNHDCARVQVHSNRATTTWRTAGGQTAKIHPTGPHGQIWTIGFQDVLAIGHLLETGTYDPIRFVTVRRSGGRGAATVRVPLGAELQPLLAAELEQRPRNQLVSGSDLHGRPASYLGRYHDSVGTTRPKPKIISRAPRPLIPLGALNGVLPARVPAVPLMRALSIGDTQTCVKLGCLELLEEDVAPLSALCTSGTDYGRCLRDVLNKLRKDAA